MADPQDIPRITRVRERLHALGATRLAEMFGDAEGVPLETMLGASRLPRVVRARRRLWVLLRTTLRLSSRELGDLVEVHHTTVVKARLAPPPRTGTCQGGQ